MHETTGPVRIPLRQTCSLYLNLAMPLFYSYSNRLQEWSQSRVRSHEGANLLKELFAYDPDRRLTAGEALQHRWFQEDPLPSRKCVFEGFM